MGDKKIDKIILFDFDGVIVDSFKPAFETNKIFHEADFSEDDYRKYFEGNFFDEYKQKGGADSNTEKFFEIYIPKLFQLPVIDGSVRH